MIERIILLSYIAGVIVFYLLSYTIVLSEDDGKYNPKIIAFIISLLWPLYFIKLVFKHFKKEK